MSNIKQFPMKKEVDEYRTLLVNYCPTELKPTTNFETGEQRNKRWGLLVNLNIVPQLDKFPVGQGPLVLENLPSEFFAADTLEALRTRVIEKLDEALAMAKMSVEQPEELEKLIKERMKEMMDQQKTDSIK